MNVSARSYLTAGVAALGAGAIALTPIQPIPNQVAAGQQKAVANLAVALASTIDPITPIVDTFTTSFANVKTLAAFYLQKPFPLLQTVAANTATYFGELTSGNADLIPGQIWNNVQTFFQAPWSPGEQFPLQVLVTTPPTEALLPLGEYVSETLNGGDAASPYDVNLGVLQIVAGASLDADFWASVAPLVPVFNFLNTPYSGQLLGVVGTLISPLVQLTKSFTAVGDFFKAGDVIGAINELINIPINTTNAFLNGAGYLNLGPILTNIVPDSPIPLDDLGFNLGGLLNSMPQNGSVVDPADPPTKYSVGVGIDGLAGNLSGFSIPGIPNGWTGSAIGLGQFLSEQLLVKPPPAPTQAVAPAAAAAVAAPVVAEAPAPAAAVADDPAPAEAAAPVVAEVAEVAEAPETPAPRAVSAAAPQQRAAAADNTGSGRTSHTGARGKHRNG